MKRISHLLFLTIGALISISAYSQSNLSLDQYELNNYYRRAQLTGQFDSLVSFLIRPLNNQVFETGPYHLDNGQKKLLNEANFQVELLPILSRSKYNLKQPYGWNDGSLLPASGYQQSISGGIAAKAWWLRVQVNPEYHYAQNKEFDGFPSDAYNELWRKYYSYHLNYIDRPERFGESQINEFRLVNSFAKLDLGPISIGISNENLWWGPGRRNSLIMSNNPIGFWHLSLNTNKPIPSAIGAFEFQIIGAKLENSGHAPPGSFRTASGEFIYNPPNNDWRYMSGITFNYHPKWIPGLFLGFSSVMQQYGERVKENKKYFHFFKFRDSEDFDDQVNEDQLASLFIRYFSQKTNSEFYFEYAKNDASWNFRDFFLEPGHAAAFIAGFTKLFPFKKKEGEFIEGNFEWGILQQSANRIIRDASTFYIHSSVRQGYTNQGEILGAGIGPSSNSQTFSVKWVESVNTLGIRLERLVYNNDLYIDLFQDVRDPRRHWIDISAFALGSWKFGDVLVDGEFGVIKSLNYQYQLLNQIRTPQFFVPGIDVINFSGSLSISYFF